MRGKFLVFLLLLIFSLVACSSNEKKEQEAISRPAKVKVETYVANTEEVKGTRSFTGQVVSKNTAFVVPKIVGYISAINVKVGDRIKKGDLLVELVSKELNDKKKFAEAAVKEAENGLKQAEIGLKLAESGYKQALAQFELANKTFKRFQKLYKAESVSEQEYDEVKAKYKLALEGKDMAEKNVELAKEKYNQVKLKKLQAESMLNEVNTYVNYTKLKAPFDGIVLENMSDVGNLASYSTPILKIGTIENEIMISIPENFYKNLKIGAKTLIKIPSVSKEFTSEIIEISKDINPASRTFNIKLRGDNQLVPGMYAEGYFESGKEDTTVIPKNYLFERGQIKFVFVDKDGIAEMRMVKTGETLGDKIEIISGINSGDKIVRPLENVQIKSGDILEAK